MTAQVLTITASPIPAGTKAEGSPFTRTVHSTAVTSATPAFVGAELAVTDEWMLSTGERAQGVKQSFIVDRLTALANRIDTDLLATVLGSSNTSGSDTTTVTREVLQQAIGAYWTQALGGGTHVVLLSTAAATHLAVDTLTTTATAAEVNNLFGAGIVIGDFSGFTLVRADNAPAEGNGFSSVITPIGNMRSGLLIANGFGASSLIEARPPQRGAEGEREAEEYSVVRAYYGVADDDGFYRELQSAA